MQAQKAQGTEDLYGPYMQSWEAMVDAARTLFSVHGFSRMETPVLEQLDTFVHGIGESTDVVRKEMFRVYSGALLERLFAEGSEQSLKPRQRLALRPEGTAGIVRSVVENNLVPQGAAPLKVWYAMPMFRGERPQKGRLRQFHQIGLEHIGSDDASADAEAIILLMKFFEALGLSSDKLSLRINSMGDAACRPAYRERVRQFIVNHKDEMCDDCLERAELNPLRAFDCKNESCQRVMADAPRIDTALCDECATHYTQLKAYLDAAGIAYAEDPRLVRGLDYYTRTVFEVDVVGAEDVGAIGGGGRYDGLVELEGGRPTPGLGFAVGFERIALALKALGIEPAAITRPSVYVACTDKSLRAAAFSVALDLREHGILTELDYQSRSLKSQFKQADKLASALCVVMGPDEYAQGKASVRNMHTHEQSLVELAQLSDELFRLLAE